MQWCDSLSLWGCKSVSFCLVPFPFYFNEILQQAVRALSALTLNSFQCSINNNAPFFLLHSSSSPVSLLLSLHSFSLQVNTATWVKPTEPYVLPLIPHPFPLIPTPLLYASMTSTSQLFGLAELGLKCDQEIERKYEIVPSVVCSMCCLFGIIYCFFGE